MSNRIRTNTQDLWIVDDVEYGVSQVTADGVVLIEVDGDKRARSFSHVELLGALQTGDADLKRDYFAPDAAASTMLSPVEYLADLDREMQRLVLWRLAYVMAFASREQAGGTSRTPHGVSAILADLEREVDRHEQIRQTLTKSAKRAGRSSSKRDAPSASTLLAWVRRWECAGRDPRSLIPHTHKSGNRRHRFPRPVEELIANGIERYASFQRPSIRQTTHSILQCVRSLNRDRRSSGQSDLRIPSQRTIARRISNLDAYSTYAQRYGAAAANRKFGAYEDGIKASFPMERVEIDEWKVDAITLLDAIGAFSGLPATERERLETSRLCLYLAICCATRCVVGMHLCDQPNGADAKRLLSLMTRDKTDLADAAGCESAWHHGGGIGLVSADLGSAFIDERFQTAVLDLRAQLAHPPGELPRLRARVERIFGTFGTQIMPMLAGRTFSNPQERGDYPSEALAVHTRETLMQILTLHVVDIYHNTPHRGLRGETPADCWERLSAKMGTLPYPGAIERTAVFGIDAERKLTGRGVTVYGISYACDYLRERRKRVGEDTVLLRTNPEDLGFVMVWTGKAWVQARAIQSCFEGVSLGQWRQASRELHLRHAERAELKEHVVQRALKKVESINAEQIAKFNVTIPFLSKKDLAREERQLHLGLTIRPQDQPRLDLPLSQDGIGSEVPLTEQAPDLFNQHTERTTGTSSAKDHTHERKWGLEDDE
ncbi:hypothetical protein [uncultured Tateyamaria sp.]|uniref:hypothetical protein n=1 Tax=Tateyamaria sp. 1078 TaxID=3417464 RepID=UPI00262E5306|nr:hypothetical protein [uncultured Tateyamaria sp.]